MTPAKLLLSRLAGVTKTADGWRARCPAHADRQPSLSISEGSDGRVLVHCHAGCSTESICQSLGLSVNDLFQTSHTSASRRSTSARRTPGRTRSEEGGQTFVTCDAAIETLTHSLRTAPANHWTYQDACGNERFVVVRFDMPTGKTFRPIRRTTKGWRIGDPPGPLPLYRLPEIATATRVFVTEGEKAAEAARSIGLVATTSAHGAKSPSKTDWSPLAGKDVVILPDNDTPGREYAAQVRQLLSEVSPPARTLILELPGLPEQGDLFDFLEQRDAVEPEALRCQLETLVAVAEREEQRQLAEHQPGPVLTCLADIEPQNVRWLWPGRIPLGRLTLLVGRPGEGKSFVTTDMAARVSTGTAWPDGSECPQGSVVLISAEDDPADTIRPRLDAQEADVRRVHLLSTVRRLDPEGKTYEVMFTLSDLAALETALERLSDVRLVVLDPIGSFLGGGVDAHRDNEVRGVLGPVTKLAEKLGFAFVVVAHRRKSLGSVADDLALGSRAFTGLARAVWHLSRDRDNKARRLLLPGKNNLAPEGQGLAFTIWGEPGALLWEPDPVAMTADDGLAAEERAERPGPQADDLRDATTFLQDVLAGGPRLTKDVEDEGHQAHGFARRTLQRARKNLGIESFREEVPGPWWLRLPSNTAKAAKEEELGALGTVAKTAEF